MKIKTIKKLLKYKDIFNYYLDVYRTGKRLLFLTKDILLLTKNDKRDLYKKERELSIIQWKLLNDNAIKRNIHINKKLFSYLMIGTQKFC